MSTAGSKRRHGPYGVRQGDRETGDLRVIMLDLRKRGSMPLYVQVSQVGNIINTLSRHVNDLVKPPVKDVRDLQINVSNYD
jgi:hypothetical protein